MKKLYLSLLLVGTAVFSQSPGAGVTDIDGNVYPTVIIGGQEWMQTNLKVTKYNNSDPIPTTSFFSQNYSAEPEPKYQWQSLESGVSGRHYTWFVATDPRGLCPTGWRVPSAGDWETLVSHLGGFLVAGGKMKETGLTHWMSPNTGATNESNFNVLPEGYHHMFGWDDTTYYNAFFTSSTEYSDDANWFIYLSWMEPRVFANLMSPMNQMGLSCRCIKGSSLGTGAIEQKAKIFPNPLSGNVLTIATNDMAEKSVTIYNSLGQSVFHTVTSTDKLEVNLSKGIYLVEIVQSGKRYVEKLLIN